MRYINLLLTLTLTLTFTSPITSVIHVDQSVCPDNISHKMAFDLDIWNAATVHLDPF